MASNSNEDEFLDSSGELHSDDKVDIETKHEVSDNSELIGRYRREANEIGLKGKELTSYITNSLATHYEDLRKKELIAMELEKQQKLKSMELDKQQELKSMELKLKADEMRLKEEENEIRKAEMLQKERLHKESLTAKKNDKAAASKPKLPYFEDSKDDIESYLFRFENHANALSWPKTDWSTSLSALLKGKALTYFREIPFEKAKDYDFLKDHLLKRFQCTEEGFRSLFRSAKPESQESISTFAFKANRLFDRWLDLANVTDFDDLKDLILREQFLASVSSPLSTFLKEKKHSSFKAMIEDAEKYQEAHPNQNISSSSKANPLLVNSCIQNTMPNSQTTRHAGRGGYANQKSSQSSNAYRGGQSQGRGSFFQKRGRGSYFQKRGGGQSTQNADSKSSACYFCNSDSHKGHECHLLPSLQELLKTLPNTKKTLVGLSAKDDLPDAIQTCQGSCNGVPVEIMLDSGCTTVGVKRSLVCDDQFTGQVQRCQQFDGSIVELPLAIVNLDCKFYSGSVEACVIENPVCDIILGNVEGSTFHCVPTQAVQTRAQAKENKPFRPLLTSKAPKLNIAAEDCAKAQKADESLKNLFGKVSSPGKRIGNQIESFVVRDGLLYRRLVNVTSNQTVWQLCVPKPLRESVLIATHDSIFGGHMAFKSTLKRIYPFFFWPGYAKEIKEYCRSCTICQKTFPKGRVAPAPLQEQPLIDVPFSRVAIDLVGPITPASGRGHRWILTLVDIATRYPDAIPLKSITTEAVAESLVDIFSRVGIPDEILSDNGSQFTSDVMREVSRLLSVAQLHSSIYHPMTNGLVERFNGTLKNMLKRLMSERPSDWDRYINAALFAYREIPQETTGFSPFELLYGRNVKGPSQLLYEQWTQKNVDAEERTVSEYVQNLATMLQDRVKEAQDAVQNSSRRSRKRQKAKAKSRSLEPGEKVLVLLPQTHNKMLLKWFGPYKVLKKVREHDYLVEQDGGVQKIYHVNLLRKFIERTNVAFAGSALGVIVEEKESEDFEKVELIPVPVEAKETINDVKFHDSLAAVKKAEARTVLQKHEHVLTDLPGTVDLVEHPLNLISDEQVNVKQYPLPFEAEKTVKEEVQKMLQLGIIEPSTSPYSSPTLLVKKPDGSYRFCIDFRRLNRITKFDAEPIPDPEVLFAKLRDKKYISKFDLAKGYWQVPMRPCDRPKTAFRTPDGLFQCVKMPFGLSTAPSTFARMMRMLDLEKHSAFNFFDDVLVANNDWDAHMQSCDGVLKTFAHHGLTVRPSKVEIGMDAIEFLGHKIGQNMMSPVDEKITKVLRIAVPKSKKQVRAVLGLIGFYRRYVENFASLVAPLVELTKKNSPAKVKWSEKCEVALKKIQEILSSHPVILLPDFTKDFVIRTDASSTGLGAVLLQEGEDKLLHPVMYASRKLLDRETRYATVERECLAVVWAIDKFHRYIFGRHFFLETDHRPLTFLANSRSQNQRLMRWALALQDYSFSIIPIAGVTNHEADVLSRL